MMRLERKDAFRVSRATALSGLESSNTPFEGTLLS
jgi:hypothetical protein